MGEGDTGVSSSWRPADPYQKASGDPPEKERTPRSPGTRLLLSRLPVTILVVAYVFGFLLTQMPEFAGVNVLGQIGRQASVLVWASLPGLNGAGAAGTDGVFLLIALIGAVALAVLGKRPSFPMASLPAAALVVLGIVFRVVSVLSQSWSPFPVGGLAFGLLAVLAAIFAVREILLAPPAEGGGSLTQSSLTQSSMAQSGLATERAGAGWRGTRWLFLVLLTWIGDVAIGRYFEPNLVAAINATPPAARWHYLGDRSSWWLYLLGAIVVVIVYAIAQSLPPWDGKARQVVIAAVVIIAGIVAFQQARPYVQTSVTHVVRYGPSKTTTAI